MWPSGKVTGLQAPMVWLGTLYFRMTVWFFFSFSFSEIGWISSNLNIINLKSLTNDDCLVLMCILMLLATIGWQMRDDLARLHMQDFVSIRILNACYLRSSSKLARFFTRYHCYQMSFDKTELYMISTVLLLLMHVHVYRFHVIISGKLAWTASERCTQARYSAHGLQPLQIRTG